MISSASANVCATMGSLSRSSRSMLTYCEPCPVYRNAVLGAGPWPMNTPRERSILRSSGAPPVSAWMALPALSASSAAAP